MPRSAALNARLPRPTRPPPTRPPLKPTPLWPFFAIAALIVVTIGSLAFVRRGGGPDLQIRDQVRGTPTPTAERSDSDPSRPANSTFLSSGSWTMSSLPECFAERERRRGLTAELRARFPPASTRLAPGSVVHAGECTVTVGAHDLRISRGADALRVPPEARLYRDAGGLTLVYIKGAHAEIRRY